MTLVRAWSTLNLKSLDEETREFAGIATTPSTDRIGDVVESSGAQFKLPLPLLAQHDTGKPIGHITYAKVTDAGIEVRGHLQKPYDGAPPSWAERLNVAWADIKTGLVRGLSIGFKPLESEPIKGSRGERFTKWLWLELSAVTIPANADATITTIKSIDTTLRAASGRSTPRVVRLDSTSAGVTANANTPPEEGTKMNVAEQIKAFEAKRMALATTRDGLMDKAAQEGSTLDKEQGEQYDTMTADLKSIDVHLERLHEMEASQAARARPVGTVRSVDDGARDREVTRDRDFAARHITVEANLEKGIEFTRLVRCIMLAKGFNDNALAIAKTRFPDNPRVAGAIKAAVAAGTTTDATWAGPFVEFTTLANEFIEYLRPMTIVGKFGTNGIPPLHSVPFNIRMLMQTSGGEGYWVGQGAPKPLTKFDFDAVTLGFSKVANIAVITQELARFSNPSADAQVRRSLAEALRARIDIDFVDPAKALVANVSPASITNGITAIPSSGSDLNSVRADLEALFGAFISANQSLTSGVWIMGGNNALALSMMRNELGQPSFAGVTPAGGSFMGLPVIVSQHVPGDSSGGIIVLVNADDIMLADDGQFTIDASDQASLQMDDAPTNNSATPTATSVVSMFQTNSIALKCERFINWQRRRDSAVQYLSNAAYTSVTAP